MKMLKFLNLQKCMSIKYYGGCYGDQKVNNSPPLSIFLRSVCITFGLLYKWACTKIGFKDNSGW